MNSYSLKQEFENICFRASVSIGTYDDVYKWLLQNNTNQHILSSEDVIILLFKYKAPLYIIKTLLNVLPNAGKIIGDNGQYLLHMACSFGASIEVVQIYSMKETQQ